MRVIVKALTIFKTKMNLSDQLMEKCTAAVESSYDKSLPNRQKYCILLDYSDITRTIVDPNNSSTNCTENSEQLESICTSEMRSRFFCGE